jgi:hypothetical protein
MPFWAAGAWSIPASVLSAFGLRSRGVHRLCGKKKKFLNAKAVKYIYVMI